MYDEITERGVLNHTKGLMKDICTLLGTRPEML